MHGSKDPLTCQKIVMRSNSASLSKFQSFNLLLGANSSGKSTYIAQGQIPQLRCTAPDLSCSLQSLGILPNTPPAAPPKVLSWVH